MRFENTFQVDAPVDEVYGALLDLEKVAPAMPGAQVTEKVSDDAYKVSIKVKLGPMTMNYTGDVEIRDRDPDAYRATLHVKAREARGQGTATADVVQSLSARDGGTEGRIEAEVQLAGRAAAMGRGLIEDVSAKLVQQFADNLGDLLGSSGGGGAEAGATGDATASAEPEPTGEGAASPEARPAGGAAASVEGEAARLAPSPPPHSPAHGGDAIDAGALASGVLRKKLAKPGTIGAIAVVLLIVFLVRRR